MKKHYKKAFYLFSFLVCLQQCSNINLIPSLVPHKKAYVFLGEAADTESFTVTKVSDNTNEYITYDTILNYFILDDGADVSKINGEGEVLFKHNLMLGELPYKSSYFFTDSLVYDLAENAVEAMPFFKFIEQDSILSKENWLYLFEFYYDQAITVIYANDECVYLEVNEGWIRLPLMGYFYFDGDNISERTFENYPAKYRPLIYLKDVQGNTYSDWASSLSFEIANEYNPYPESALLYSKYEIEKISFQKESVTSRNAYTPFVAQFGGIGYYKLNMGKDEFLFKEMGFKLPFNFFSSNDYLYHYMVPEKFVSKTQVSFLKYALPTNQNERESQGLYVIKRK